jgi:hypothetical protein
MRGAGVSTVSYERSEPSVPALPDLVTPAETNTAYPDTVFIPAQEGSGSSAKDHRVLEVTRLGAAVEVLVGVWLGVSPWVVGSGGSSVLRWNDVSVGAVLAVLAFARLARPSLPRTPSVSFGLGAWTIVAAFVLSFQNGSTGTAPLWNAIVCGAALTAAAAWSTTETERAALRRG